MKNTVGNKARIEGSICSAYPIQETSTFCSYYFYSHDASNQMDVTRNVSCTLPIGVNAGDLFVFTSTGRTLGRATGRVLTDVEYHLIQTYILMNCEEVEPFIKCAQIYIFSICLNYLIKLIYVIE